MSDVVIVGAGPAGLTAARILASKGYDVRVLDRDAEPGGVPRHSDHLGYGLREFGRRQGHRRILTGPEYARYLTDRAMTAGANIDVRSTVTSIELDGTTAMVTSPSGRSTVQAGALVLATGCRERPRSARLVPGSRPSGIYTTGWLQRLVHLEHRSPGTSAVVVGAEHVSYSAVMTLAESGCRTVAMVTDQANHSSFAVFDVAARNRYRFPLMTQARIIDIHGKDRVTGVTLLHEDGRRAEVACDTIVFTGEWRAEDELAVSAGLLAAPGDRGPSYDSELRTGVPGLFIAGNLAHPGATAHTCADDGIHVADAVDRWLREGTWPTASVPLQVAAPLRWSAPDILVPGQPARRIRLMTDIARDLPRLIVRQGRRDLWAGRLPAIRPTRSFAISGNWATRTVPHEPVTICLA